MDPRPGLSSPSWQSPIFVIGEDENNIYDVTASFFFLRIIERKTVTWWRSHAEEEW